MYNSEMVTIVHRAMGEPTLFCRKDGSFVSLLTSDCIFSRQEAWHFVNCRPCDLSKFETYVFKTISEGVSYLGLSPSEMAEKKRLLIAEYAKTHKSVSVERKENAPKKKKTSAEIEESVNLFSDMVENREQKDLFKKYDEPTEFSIF